MKEVDEKSDQLISQIPLSMEATFPSSSCHDKGVSAIALDKNQGRYMVTGSGGDYAIKLWDFQEMNKTLRPYKEFKPFPGYPVHSICFSRDANTFLVCCANN